MFNRISKYELVSTPGRGIAVYENIDGWLLIDQASANYLGLIESENQFFSVEDIEEFMGEKLYLFDERNIGHRVIH